MGMGLAIKLRSFQPNGGKHEPNGSDLRRVQFPGTESGYPFPHLGGRKAKAIGKSAGIEYPARRHGR